MGGDQGRVENPQEGLSWNLFNWEKDGRFNSWKMLHFGSLLRSLLRLGLWRRGQFLWFEWPCSVGFPASEGPWSVASKML